MKELNGRIARAMTEGHSKSATQCKEKAKKLKTEYRKVQDKHRVTGEGRKKWKFLEAMDNVLADKPSTQPSTPSLIHPYHPMMIPLNLVLNRMKIMMQKMIMPTIMMLCPVQVRSL